MGSLAARTNTPCRGSTTRQGPRSPAPPRPGALLLPEKGLRPLGDANPELLSCSGFLSLPPRWNAQVCIGLHRGPLHPAAPPWPWGGGSLWGRRRAGDRDWRLAQTLQWLRSSPLPFPSPVLLSSLPVLPVWVESSVCLCVLACGLAGEVVFLACSCRLSCWPPALRAVVLALLAALLAAVCWPAGVPSPHLSFCMYCFSYCFCAHCHFVGTVALCFIQIPRSYTAPEVATEACQPGRSTGASSSAAGRMQQAAAHNDLKPWCLLLKPPRAGGASACCNWWRHRGGRQE